MLVENVIIKRVGEVQKGTSETTGKPWANRNLLLSFEDEFGESYINAAVGEDVWQRLGFHEGQVVSLNLRFRTARFRNGYVSNDIRVFIPKNIQ